MTQAMHSLELLQETKRAFSNVRYSVVEAMVKLHEVKEYEVWKQVSPTWGEYVERELGISQSFASKLLTVNKHYLLAGIPQEKIANVDYECLYLATKTPGDTREQLERATLLSRRELKQSRNDEKPHEHEPITICRICALRL